MNIKVHTPCPDCTSLWIAPDERSSCQFISTDKNEITVCHKGEFFPFLFYYHPSCEKHNHTIKPVKKEIQESDFSPLKELESNFDPMLNMYFSNAIGLFSFNKGEFSYLSGQGRATTKEEAECKSKFELIERISTISLPQDQIQKGFILGSNLHSPKKKQRKIPINLCLPNGLYGCVNSNLPLQYGIAVHTDRNKALENAFLECLERVGQKRSLLDGVLFSIDLNSLPEPLCHLVKIIDGNLNTIHLFAEKIYENNWFICSLFDGISFPNQMLTSSVDPCLEAAIRHSLLELIEKYNFLHTIKNELEEYEEEYYPWMYFVKNISAPRLLSILGKTKQQKNTFIDLLDFSSQAKQFEGNFMVIDRENALSKQLNIYVKTSSINGF